MSSAVNTTFHFLKIGYLGMFQRCVPYMHPQVNTFRILHQNDYESFLHMSIANSFSALNPNFSEACGTTFNMHSAYMHSKSEPCDGVIVNPTT